MAVRPVSAGALKRRGPRGLRAAEAANDRRVTDSDDEEGERRMLHKKHGPYTDILFPGNPLDIFPGRRERGGSRWDPPYR